MLQNLQKLDSQILMLISLYFSWVHNWEKTGLLSEIYTAIVLAVD
jgi:hypothetical protein